MLWLNAWLRCPLFIYCIWGTFLFPGCADKAFNLWAVSKAMPCFFNFNQPQSLLQWPVWAILSQRIGPGGWKCGECNVFAKSSSCQQCWLVQVAQNCCGRHRWVLSCSVLKAWWIAYECFNLWWHVEVRQIAHLTSSVKVGAHHNSCDASLNHDLSVLCASIAFLKLLCCFRR